MSIYHTGTMRESGTWLQVYASSGSRGGGCLTSCCESLTQAAGSDVIYNNRLQQVST